jgi:hypothetical protein
MRTAVLMTALMATVFVAHPSRQLRGTALGRSADVFYRYFQALRQEPLNPVERVAFSLVLTKANIQENCHS